MILRLCGSMLKSRWYVVDEANMLRSIDQLFTADSAGEYAIDLAGPMTFVSMRERPDEAPMYKVREASPTRGFCVLGDMTPSEFEDFVEAHGIDIGAMDLVLPRIKEEVQVAHRREETIAQHLLLSVAPIIPPPPKQRIQNDVEEIKRRWVARRLAAASKS